MSKKAKAEAYDKLSDRAGLMEMMLYDIATGKNAEAPVTVTEIDGHDDEEAIEATGTLYRMLGSQGGVVLLHTCMRYASSADSDGHMVKVLRLDDMSALTPPETYFLNAWGRAVHTLIGKLKAIRGEAYEVEWRINADALARKEATQ